MKCVHEVHTMNILQVSYVRMLTYLQKKMDKLTKNLVLGSISRVGGEFTCSLCHSSTTHIWITNRTYQKWFNQYLVHEIKCRSRYEHHFYVKQFFIDSSSPLYYQTVKDKDISGQNTIKSFSSHISYMFWPNTVIIRLSFLSCGQLDDDHGWSKM